ncbi:hypothetical protein CCMA1212_001461, partial [Trichoderma ghanense]
LSSVRALVVLARRLSPTPGFRGRWAANFCVYCTLLLGGHDGRLAAEQLQLVLAGKSYYVLRTKS